VTAAVKIVFAVEAAGGGFAVTSNARTAKTPAGHAFVVPTVGLAQAVAAELTTHGVKATSAMRFRRMAVAAIERDGDGGRDAVDGVAAYANTDLLCYRAAAPPDLVHRQDEAWQPLLDWAAETYGARLASTSGVMPIEQDADARARLHGAVSALGPWQRAGVAAAVVVTGSLVLGLALERGRVDAEEAWRVSRIDHDYQAGQRGADEEAKAVAAEVRADLDAAGRFLQLLAG
jgi:chaperone required for assembly of F1-ATPase